MSWVLVSLPELTQSLQVPIFLGTLPYPLQFLVISCLRIAGEFSFRALLFILQVLALSGLEVYILPLELRWMRGTTSVIRGHSSWPQTFCDGTSFGPGEVQQHFLRVWIFVSKIHSLYRWQASVWKPSKEVENGIKNIKHNLGVRLKAYSPPPTFCFPGYRGRMGWDQEDTGRREKCFCKKSLEALASFPIVCLLGAWFPPWWRSWNSNQ